MPAPTINLENIITTVGFLTVKSLDNPDEDVAINLSQVRTITKSGTTGCFLTFAGGYQYEIHGQVGAMLCTTFGLWGK